MRALIIALSLPLYFSSPAFSQEYAKEQVGTKVTKQFCILLADYPDKGINEIRGIMLQNVKRAALSEIYGQKIRSATEVRDFQLTSDLISDESLGIIRIEGDPKYYNGPNFGEVCVKIDAYVTKEDLQKFKKKEIAMTDYCYSDPNVPLKELKNKARESAYLEVVRKHNPSLSNIDPERASQLVHDFSILKENLDLNTGAYCIDLKANIVPFELEYASTEVAGTSLSVAKTKKTYKPTDILFHFDPDKYEEGHPLSGISKKGMIVKSKVLNKPVISTTLGGDDKLTFEGIAFTKNFQLTIDCGFADGGKSEIALLDTKTEKEYTFLFDENNYITLFNGERAKYTIQGGTYYRLKFSMKDNVLRLFVGVLGKKEENLIAGMALDNSQFDFDALTLSLHRRIAYGDIKVTAQ